MLGNLVNANDFRRLARKVGQGEFRRIYHVLRRGRAERVAESWAPIQGPPTNWWDVPAVRVRWNTMVSGHPEVDHYEHLGTRYLAGRRDLRGLSLGCGTGQREIRWAQSRTFRRIDACDVSLPRIAQARQRARQEGLNDVLHFHVSDALLFWDRPGVYDVVFGEGSLHHLTPLGRVLDRIEAFLKPRGYFFVNDFVGPTRMQWTRRQLEVINGLLAVLPERFRRRYEGGSLKSQQIRPSRLSMLLGDPSEAVESGRILPMLRERFDVVELKEYGGTVLHMLLNEIAHNFLADDLETRRALRMCFDAEDLLLASGELSSDFVVAVCRKKRQAEDADDRAEEPGPSGD